MNTGPVSPQVKILRLYYAATALFIVLDYWFGINVRLAGLEQAPAWRGPYYLLCFACLCLMYWRPAWSPWIATAESLLTLSMLIINMALRVMIVTDAMLETGRGFVSMGEIGNFMLASGVAYVAYWSGVRTVRRDIS